MYQWTGNVGLVNVSDLLRASTNIACTSATDEFNAFMQEETCGSYLTTFNEEITYWTMNVFSAESDDYSSFAWCMAFIQGIGTFGNNYAYSECGARPVVFLKSSIKLSGGTGTETDPYIIEE